LAKDCGSRHNSKFAVMIKREDEDEQKTLKIVTEQVKLMPKPPALVLNKNTNLSM
jgi:hypothetical protein